MTEEKEGRHGSKSLVWAALVMVGLMAVVGLMLLSTPGVGSDQDRVREEKNLENMQQLARACLLYAEDNGGVLPESLAELVAETRLGPEILYSPFTKDRSAPSYELAQRGRIYGSETPLSPEILFAPVNGGNGEGVGASSGSGRYEVPANVILIIEREGLRRGGRRFVLLDGTPGSLDLDIGPEPSLE